MRLERYNEAAAINPIAYKTGLSFLDKNEAFTNHDFMIIGGSTGTGKSYISMYIALTAAKYGAKVLYINAEMFCYEFVRRMGLMGFDFKKDFGEFKDGYSRLKVMHQEDYKQDITFSDIEGWVVDYRPDILVLDLFSCFITDSQNIYGLTKKWATELSFYPKKYGCAVIATEQFTKDKRTGDRPSEDDIGGGRDLTRKASKIILLYNHYYNNFSKAYASKADEELMQNSIEVIVKKDRCGRVGVGTYLQIKEAGYKPPTINQLAIYKMYAFGGKQ